MSTKQPFNTKIFLPFWGWKASRLATAQEHLLHAKTEHNHYNSQVDTAQKVWTSSKATEQSPRIGHYSYNFAQQIHYPYDSQQTGPEYFKTARKCGLFGVCNDGNNKQVLYLIDEAENPGKGADCVISSVHHYLENYAEGEKCVYLHADNCIGQNKNNATIQNLLWRVLTGHQERIELSFMLVGHTRFSPDRHFGTFKKAFRVSTLAEIAMVAERTSTNIPQLIRDSSGTVTGALLPMECLPWQILLDYCQHNVLPLFLKWHHPTNLEGYVHTHFWHRSSWNRRTKAWCINIRSTDIHAKQWLRVAHPKEKAFMYHM